jgi:hypothetical protein
MAPINAESHAISAFPQRHCCICWTIACHPVLTPPPDPLPLPTRSPKTRSGLPEKTSDKCDLLHSLSD